MKTNRKGFTITELVIVIVVIAILAAVLIPTFAGLIKKANISADTQMAKNLNTALTMAEASGEEIDEFGEALNAMREAGYLLANLNPTTQGCYLVWESETNQVLLVDGEDNYKVIYHAKDGYGDPDNSWYFAINDKAAADKVTTDLPNVNVKNTITNAAALSEMLNDDDVNEIFIDESLALDSENLLEISKDMVIDLGNATLNTNGVLPNVTPIQITEGNTTIKGGIISAIGSGVDEEGDPITKIVEVAEGSSLTLEGSTISASDGGGKVLFGGNGSLKDVTINTQAVGLDLSISAKVTLENTTITCTGTGSGQGACVWVCSYKWDDVNSKWIHGGGDSKATIVSGTYSGGNGGYAAIVSCTGDVEIQGGTFTAPAGKMFDVRDASKGEIVIKGGTFNGKTLAELGVDGLKALCTAGCTVTESNGVYTISK